MKYVSTYISLMIVLLITITTGFVLYIWLHNLATQTGQETEEEIISMLQCRKASMKIEKIEDCNSNYINFSVRNNGRVDLKDFIVSVKFKDNRIVNYEDVFECFTNEKLKLYSGETKCAYIFDNNNDLTRVLEISITSKHCPNVYDSLIVMC